jgi:hypothetical protein
VTARVRYDFADGHEDLVQDVLGDTGRAEEVRYERAQPVSLGRVVRHGDSPIPLGETPLMAPAHPVNHDYTVSH